MKHGEVAAWRRTTTSARFLNQQFNLIGCQVNNIDAAAVQMYLHLYSQHLVSPNQASASCAMRKRRQGGVWLRETILHRFVKYCALQHLHGGRLSRRRGVSRCVWVATPARVNMVGKRFRKARHWLLCWSHRPLQCHLEGLYTVASMQERRRTWRASLTTCAKRLRYAKYIAR